MVMFASRIKSLSAIIFTNVARLEMAKFSIFSKLMILYLLYGWIIGFYGFGRISARFGPRAAQRCSMKLYEANFEVCLW